MRTMKDSGIEWIGQIPESWSVEALKRNVKIEMGQSPASECYNSDGVGFPFLQGNADFTDKFPVERMYTSAANKFSKTGDLLLSVRAPVGAVNIADKEYAIGRGLCAITGGRISIPFLWYAIAVLNHEFDANSTGSTFESINTEDVGNAKIMVPGEDEQRRIAEYLDVKCAEIDALIAAKEKTNALLKERRQSIIYEAVTKGLNPDAPMKDSGIEWIGTIPQNSNIVRFKYLCDIFGRIGFRGYTQADIVAEGEGPITLSPSNIEAYGMDFSKCTYLTWDKYNESPEIQVGVGDILLVKTGSSYGKSAIIETIPMEATINPQLVVVKNIKCNARYLYYCMQTDCFAYQVERAVVGGTIPTMAQEKINNFIVVLPEDDLCEEIVVYLDQKCEEINRMVTANEATIQKLKEYRQSVIYEAVTGKIEI